MLIILRQDIEKVGKAGEVIKVKDGFARNYLIPNQLAFPATDAYMNRYKETTKSKGYKAAQIKKSEEFLKNMLEEKTVTIKMKVGEENRLFGSVTSQNIADELKAAGIDVPRSMVVREDEWVRDSGRVKETIAETFDIPFAVKPIREGSSMGVTIVRNADMLEEGMADAFKLDKEVLVEEYLTGIEFSCIVLEREGKADVLGVTEIHPQSDFYSYDDKYMPGRCSKFTPPKNIPAEVIDRIKANVVRAFETLGFRSYGRIDGFVLEDGRVLITDPNSSSGMAPSSFFFEQAAEAGMLPSMILSELIEISRSVHRDKKGPLQ